MCKSARKATSPALAFLHSTLRRRRRRIAFMASRMLPCWLLLALLSDAFVGVPAFGELWERPGCHKIGHTRKISIANCVEFQITTNACRGFCESWAVPSDPRATPTQPVTSVGECCNMMDAQQVKATVLCKDGIRDLIFNSAVNCSCFHCKKD